MSEINAGRMEYIFLSFLDSMIKEYPNEVAKMKEALLEILYQNEIESLDLDDWLFYEN